MIVHQGIYLPDGETHLTKWMTENGEMVDGKGTYQIKKLRLALGEVRNFRSAVDIGAHVGMWTMQLAKQFKQVYSFEPVKAHFECFLKNVTAENVHVHNCALGPRAGFIAIDTDPTSSGDSYVSLKQGPEGKIDNDGVVINPVPGGNRVLPMKTLDSFGYDDVDFIKLDCEGYEYFALKGAEETIKKCKPVIIVEQKPNKAEKFGLPQTHAVSYLKTLGYEVKREISGDFIMTYFR